MAIHELETGFEMQQLPRLPEGSYTAEQAEPYVAYYMRLAAEGLHQVAVRSKAILINEASIGNQIKAKNDADLERLRQRGRR